MAPGLPTGPLTRRPNNCTGRLVPRKGCPFLTINARLRLLPLPKFRPPPSQPPNNAIPYGCIATQRPGTPDVALFTRCHGRTCTDHWLRDLPRMMNPPRDASPPSPPFLAATFPKTQRYVRSPRQPAAPGAAGFISPASPGTPLTSRRGGVHHPAVPFPPRDDAVACPPLPPVLLLGPKRASCPPPPTPSLRPPSASCSVHDKTQRHAADFHTFAEAYRL
ncbi:hypothetical protein GWK47_019616 [Chionoecetes opilio]|uniref:Uncharacterized protein n=1 Tax=Chionoecetes opilio TaxID=41210 RepID=A0A8J4XQE7_CHIOP|nr:hypothetical protein GWK47_019616 [Chionoecetes opilio]